VRRLSKIAGSTIVTGYLDSAARGMGLTAQPDHDGRYDAADEYMSVVYQRWEASWEDGALRRDKKNRIFADPAKIHRVRHHGPRYQVDAIHLSEPSLQRTPVLYQAGSSSRGREFAATHAECVFVFGADKRITRDLVADVRSRATAHGRDPKDILIFYNRAVVAGRTRREAETSIGSTTRRRRPDPCQRPDDAGAREMAVVTEHIGFGVTANLTYEPPYLFARRMSTLDHLTGGRVGWNT